MKKNGFTLIEMVMVMAIISVVAAIILPRLDPFVPQRRLKSAARRLSGAMSLCYGEAVSRNKNYRLYIDATEDKYWITEVEVIEEEEEESAAIGLRIGTRFELLEYEESGSAEIEETAPTEPLFAPTRLPQGVHFSSVDVGRGLTGGSVGVRYIEFGPLGDATPATIQLTNEEGAAFTVYYDGVTGIPELISTKSET